MISTGPSIHGRLQHKLQFRTHGDRNNLGLAISSDVRYMVVSHDTGVLSVFSLPAGELLHAFGGLGSEPGQFSRPSKLCFSAVGTILVADEWASCVQEVTLTGVHVRFIGVDVITGSISGIAANSDLIVGGKCDSTDNGRIMMFSATTGMFVRAFAAYGAEPGQLMKNISGIRFTPDNRCIVVAENQTRYGRVSVLTLTGGFVKCVGERILGNTCDVELAGNGDIIVSESSPAHRVSVFSADGGSLLRQWGQGFSDEDGKFATPVALAVSNHVLYVLDEYIPRVQIFE